MIMLTTKITKINWKYIVDNVLNREFWSKKWLLLDYDGVKIEMSLEAIYTYDCSARLNIRASNGQYSSTGGMFIYFNRCEDLEELYNRSVRRRVLEVIDSLERPILSESDGYKELDTYLDERRENVEDMANELLDDLGIIHEDIRQAYIDAQVDKNETNVLEDFLNDNKGTMLNHVRRTYLLLNGEDVEDYPTDEVLDEDIQSYIDSIEFIELEDLQ